MPRCPSCRQHIRPNQEQVGARCPSCREPLYERPQVPTRVSPKQAAEKNCCAIHPHNLAGGTCQRCGNYLCAVCRTRYRARYLCLGCVERALEAKEQAPEEARAHLRQAVLSLVFGIGGWLLLAGIFLLVAATAGRGDIQIAALFLVGLGMLASPAFGVLGLGQAAAAIRSRGDHLILATCGLFLSGLQVGIILGFFVFTLKLAW